MDETEARAEANWKALWVKFPEVMQTIQESFRVRSEGDLARQQAAQRAFGAKARAVPLTGPTEEWLSQIAEEAASKAGLPAAEP